MACIPFMDQWWDYKLVQNEKYSREPSDIPIWRYYSPDTYSQHENSSECVLWMDGLGDVCYLETCTPRSGCVSRHRQCICL